MMDLCTVTNHKYLTNAIELVESYFRHSYTGKVYLYYFDIPKHIIDFYIAINPNILFINVPKACDHAYNPKVFFYKSYAINDCSTKSQCFLYSDATNIFNLQIDIEKYFINDNLFLTYKHPVLLNRYWTTKRCIRKMNAQTSNNSSQYWAGIQGYRLNDINKEFISTMYQNMLDPDIALPDTSIKRPDGLNGDCIEHRQDQSVLSILINQFSKHQEFNIEKQVLFGDHQTYRLLDPSYTFNLAECCVIPRYSKYRK